jgi:hypothetical protein
MLPIDVIINNVVPHLPHSEKQTLICINKLYKNNVSKIPMEEWEFVEFCEDKLKKLLLWSGTEIFITHKNQTVVIKQAHNNQQWTCFVTVTEPSIIFDMIKSGQFVKPTFRYTNIIEGLPWTIIRRSIPHNYTNLIHNKQPQYLLSTDELLKLFSTEEKKINLQLSFDIFSSNKQISNIKHLQSLIWSNKIYNTTLYIQQRVSPAEIMVMFHYKQFYIPNFLRAYVNFDGSLMQKDDNHEPRKDILNIVYKIKTNGPLLSYDDNSYLLPAFSAFNYENLSLENNILIVTLNQINITVQTDKSDDNFITWLTKKGELCGYKSYCCSNLFQYTNAFITSYHRAHIG